MSRRDEVLVTTGWVADHADDPALRLVEVDEDTAAYAGGHIRNAIAWHWRDDLHEAPRREFIGQEALAAEPGPLGPGRPELRAFRDDVLAHLGGNGRSAAQEDGSFKSDDDLVVLYGGVGVTPDTDVIAYCRIGERSSHTWFVLHELLGYERVRNYDGSWTEYGSLVGVPVER